MTILHFAIANFVLVVCIHIVAYGILFFYLRCIASQGWSTPAVPFTPKTAVILTLRGADPFLNRCIEGLLKQDYPNYTVFLVVDSDSDPALHVVQDIVKKLQPNNVEVVIVDEHLKSCTLKCNSLCYVTKDIDPSYEVVAILDADTNPHPNWLRSLVEPLSDARFGAATGQRWYIPEKDNFGSLVRYLWNAASVVLCYFSRITWGGSLALKRDLFVKGNLLEGWRNAFTDDASISSALHASGMKSVFVPSLFMVNRETCTLLSFYRWVKRQLLCVKLHHPTWGVVIAHGVLIMLPLVAMLLLVIYAVIYQDYAIFAWSVGSFVLYGVGVFGTLPIMERGIRNKLRERNEPLSPWTWSKALRMLIAVPLTQCVYISALFWLHFMKKVEWRGVWYEIGKDKSVRMIEYIPYVEVQKDVAQKSDEMTSL